MNLLRRGCLALTVLAVLTSSQAFAGGGGTKKNATIKVTNKSSIVVGVYYDGGNAAIQKAFTDKSSSEFTKAGGKILNVGDTATFSVKAGAYVLVASDAAFDTPVTFGVIVKAGQTTTASIADDPAQPSGTAPLIITSP